MIIVIELTPKSATALFSASVPPATRSVPPEKTSTEADGSRKESREKSETPSLANIEQMKRQTEDYKETVDPFLALLVTLWTENISIDIKVDQASLYIRPKTSDETNAEIVEHWEQLAHWLPGQCDACEQWALQRTAIPYGANAHLCPTCRDQAVEYFEEQGYPDPAWFNHEIQ